MTPLRFVALLAMMAAANAFAPSVLSSRAAVQSTTARHDVLGGFDLATALADQGSLYAAVAAAVAAVGGFVLNGAKALSPGAVTEVAVEPEPEPEPIDVSIPYDAAARLKFAAWLGEGVEYDEATYLKFKTVYENLASAEATVSRYTRELAALK
jgi:hypothetical protein